jgi:hypothetical protein
MDTGLTLKSVANPAQMSDPRPDAAARAAVATELAPAQAVTAANGTSNTQATDDSRVRQIILDPHSREVIYRVVDVRSRRVVRQVPEEAMLRLRAYTRASLGKRNSDGSFDTTA